MVALLIATLVAAIGAWLYFRSQSAVATPPGGGSAGTGDIPVGTLGGITFTTPGSASAAAANAGATGYDPNDPASAQRRIDALARAQKLQDKADAQGITPEQDYQNHLQQSLDAQATQTAAIMARANAAAGAAAAGAAAAAASASVLAYSSGSTYTPPPPPPVKSGSNQDYAVAVLNAGPPPGGPIPPGQYWDYAQGKWVPFLF